MGPWKVFDSLLSTSCGCCGNQLLVRLTVIIAKKRNRRDLDLARRLVEKAFIERKRVIDTVIMVDPTEMTSPTVVSNEHHDDDKLGEHHSSFEEEEEDDVDLENEIQEIKSWDEGGPSDCGYSDSIHDTLMNLGGSVHGVVGDPSPSTNKTLGLIGNWFQEASYAIRDILRGKTDDMHDEASVVVNETVKTLMKGQDADEKKEENVVSRDY